MNTQPLDQILVVLHQPRDVVNIGGVVRAMKNTGVSRLRLVAPAPFTPADITGIAHRSEDVLANTQVFPTLDEALADTSYVVGTTARVRGNHLVRSDIRALAPELLRRTAGGPVALLFGPEDNGLDNDALDHCHTIVSLPINPAYPSLNLAQAALLLLYELYSSAGSAVEQDALEAATTPQLETLFVASEQALSTIQFFKSGNAAHIMRELRQVAHKAALTPREASLLTAIAREVVAFLRRRRPDESE